MAKDGFGIDSGKSTPTGGGDSSGDVQMPFEV
jgi:hypothetical protein